MVERLGKSSQPGETFFHTGNYIYPGIDNQATGKGESLSDFPQKGV
jgi:hypothetical protein